MKTNLSAKQRDNGTFGAHLHEAMIFSELSMDAYMDEADFRRKYGDRFSIELLDRDGTQCYALTSPTRLYYIFRGTEATKWSDIKADLKFRKTAASYGTAGRIHRGFKDALDCIWEDFLVHYFENQKSEGTDRLLYFAGHSLGAALATVAASRVGREDSIGYTFGSPRVGNGKFVAGFVPTFYRFRNHNDIVTRHPIPFIGYRHVGELRYFGPGGRLIEEVTRKELFMNFVKSIMQGIWDYEYDSFGDHSSATYCYCCKIAYAIQKMDSEE